MKNTKIIQGLPDAGIEAEFFFQANDSAKRKNRVTSFLLLLFSLALSCHANREKFCLF
ncbi:MAG: hypothetical protein WBG28_13250 [Desulfobulbales bacterium]